MGKAIGMTFSVGARLQSSVSGVFDTLDGRVSRLKRDLKTTRAVANAAGKLTSAKATVDSLRAQAAAGKDVGEKLKSAELAYASAARSAAKYNVSVKDSARVHAKATAQMARTEASLKRQEIYQRNRAKRGELKGEIMGTVASVATVAAPLKMAMDFESAMADAAKTIDGMRDSAGRLTPEYYKMEATVKRMGRELPLTHQELASIFAAGGQIGLQKAEDLEEFTRLVAHMSVAFGMSTEEAADAIGGYRSQMNKSFPEIREMLDLMNQYANTSSATEASISNIVRSVGSLGETAGLSDKSLTAMAATLASMKVQDDKAATGLKNFLLAFTSGEAAMGKKTKAFAQLGIDPKELAKEMQRDSEGAIMAVLKKIQGLEKYQQASILEELFGRESIGAIAPLLTRLDLLEENFKQAGDKAAYAGAMQKEFENRAKTTANALTITKNKLAEVAINAGSVLLPEFNKILTVVGDNAVAFSNFAQENPRVVRSVMRIVSALAAFKVASLSVRFASTVISDGMTMARGTMAAFRVVTIGLSKALKIAAVAQWLLNAVMSNNPIGWVIKGVMFLGGVLYGLYKKCEPVRKFFDTLWDGFLEMIKPVTSKVEWVWDKIKRIIKWFKGDDVNEAEEKADKKLAEIDEKKKAAAAGKPVVRTTAPVSVPDEDGFSSASDEEIKGRGKAAATVKPVVRTTAPVSVPDEDGFSSASGEENDAAMQAYIDSAALEAGSMPDISDMDMEDMGVSDAEISKLDVQAMSSGESGGTVTIAPTFKFEFSLDGIPDREFGKRVVDSVEREKNAIQRILSDLLRDADRRAYG